MINLTSHGRPTVAVDPEYSAQRAFSDLCRGAAAGRAYQHSSPPKGNQVSSESWSCFQRTHPKELQAAHPLRLSLTLDVLFDQNCFLPTNSVTRELEVPKHFLFLSSRLPWISILSFQVEAGRLSSCQIPRDSLCSCLDLKSYTFPFNYFFL